MDPNRQPPRYPHGHHHHHHHHHYDHLNFDIPEHQANDPNAWPGNYAPTSTSIPATAIASNPHAPWSASLPLIPQYLESDVSQAPPQHHLYQQQAFSTPSPAAFHTPLSDSYLLTHAAPSPYTYHASPSLYAHPSPVPRSMSASALSNNDLVPAPQHLSQHPAQQTPSSTFLPTPRQIRFVSSDGQPHTKRRRINAACLTCRKRKTRCSGERPECKTCTDNGHVCAGYVDRALKKDHEKRSDDGDEDDEDMSGSSSPRRQGFEHASSSGRPGPTTSGSGYGKQHSYDGGSRHRQAAQDSIIDNKSPMSSHTANSAGAASGRTRVPYFRYFGPTAIVPGFKQMVVQMKDHREHCRSHASAQGDSPAPGAQGDSTSVSGRELSPVAVDLPYYDANDPNPNPQLIKQLCEDFFTNLGCNYPFLQRQRFLQDLDDKKVDAILVNAVCAVAARFSQEPILAKSDLSLPLDHASEVKRAFRGQPFAQRAMSAVVDTFSCPTLAVTQACLLLAYEEFGSDRDSGLWMYLGTSIRMAQDLGIQKLEGLQLEGRLGSTPKTAKRGSQGKEEEEARRAEQQKALSRSLQGDDSGLLDDRRASERERIDTFWAIFFLDRAVSSGVGRPVTLRDKDIEISFPYRPNEKMVGGHPHPFPAMIKVVHMYGRVADVLNNIKDVTHVTEEVLKRLAGMEKDLTGIYQRMSPKLHFNAANFQQYVKTGQGTNFILLHFWFHTLIILLHQPTLLHSFEGSIQQLFPNSRELSISSAKTIADILAFAELIDVKSFIGNPFTSQPMYVAACAFLAEAAAHASQPPSRDHSPFHRSSTQIRQFETSQAAREAEQRLAAKHTLLATAANQNYQRCYKALKLLDSYWAGCRYILTALDQKSKGLMDPLLFTSDDVDGQMPSTEPSFTTPGWRRTSWAASLGGRPFDPIRGMRSSSQEVPWSPKMDWANAIGWSLTGTVNSPAPNLSFLYQNSTHESDHPLSPGMKRGVGPTSRPTAVQADGQQPMMAQLGDFTGTPTQSFGLQPPMLPPLRSQLSGLPYDPVATADGELLLGLHSPYSGGSNRAPSATSNPPPINTSNFDYSQAHGTSLQQHNNNNNHQTASGVFPTATTPQFGDVMIESQEIDMSHQQYLNFNNLGFPGGEMLPWLEYLPQDVLNYFGDTNNINLDMHGNTPAAGMVMPSGPGPPDTGQSRHNTPG